MPGKRDTRDIKEDDDEFGPDRIDPEVRMLRFRMASSRLHTAAIRSHTSEETERPAWAGHPSKYEQVVDPEKQLPWRERDRRAEVARKLAQARRQLAAAQALLAQSPDDEGARRKMRAATGRIGALTRSMSGYTRDMTAAARKANASLERYEQQVDPEGTMDPQVRRRKALAARRRYYKKLGKLGQEAKQRKRRARRE